MFRARQALARFHPVQARRFCDKTNKVSDSRKTEANVSNYEEAYRQLDNLDFATASKILFSEPPKKKKFGFDFHLVQFFFACLPSLAVYLVAQYARREMKKMDAELEQKRKKEEEEKAKEMEQKAIEERERAHPEILEVKERLDKLEEAVKEFVDVSKKQTGVSATKGKEDGVDKKDVAPSGHEKADIRSHSSKSVDKHHVGEQGFVERSPEISQGKLTESSSIPNASQLDQKGNITNGGTSNNAKR